MTGATADSDDEGEREASSPERIEGVAPSEPDGSGYVETRGPPVPDVAYTVINPLVSAVLRSPLHFLLSDALLLITFTGAKTGTEYTTPVGYWVRDGRLVVTTHSPWWRNLRGGQPVTLRLRGRRREGVATPHEDIGTVARYVQAFIDRRGVGAVRRLGVEIAGDREPTLEELEAGLEGTVVVEIELTDDGPAPG